VDLAQDGKDQLDRQHMCQMKKSCLVQKQRSLVQVIKQRQANWTEHVLRHDCPLKTVLEGKIEGKRPRGKTKKENAGSTYGAR